MGRIEDDGGVRTAWQVRTDANQGQRTRQEPPPPPANPQAEDGEARRAELRQYADSRREEINSAVIGGVAGENARRTGSTATGMERARAAYDEAYRQAMTDFRQFHDAQVKPLAQQLATQNGDPARPFLYYEAATRQLQSGGQVPAGTPTSMLEVNQVARDAYAGTLRQWGAQTGDVRGPDVQKAADFLLDAANGPGNLQQLDPAEVIRRTMTGEPVGDYVVRAVPRRYMYDPDAVLTRSDRAWVAPLDEMSGLRLNAGAIQERFGFHDPSEYSLMVLRRQDLPRVEVPTWGQMSEMVRSAAAADPTSPLNVPGINRPSFWETDLPNFNLDQHLAQMNAANLKPNQYAAQLNAQTPGLGDVFTVRNTMYNRFGANPQFSGEGYTLDTRGQAGVREYLIGEPGRMGLSDFPEHAFVNLDSTPPGTVETVPTTRSVPTLPGLTGRQLAVGTASAFGVSTVLSGGQAINDIMNGRDAGDALLAAGQQVGVSTAAGAGSTVIEHYSTRAISRFAGAGTTFAGQVGRQALGSGVAGGIVNTGFALYGNYEAYQSGQISGAEYTGRVAGEAAVGVAAGVAGAYAGAAIGSFIPIPVVGTLAGAAVGFAVGYGADLLMRHFEVDKAVASATTAVVEFGGQVVDSVSEAATSAFNSVTETASNVIEGAGDALGDLAGGAVNKLASIFG